MSRQSENSGASSAGDGESVHSSYESNSGSLENHCLANNPTSIIIYKVDNAGSSTSSEDQEGCELKTEYLQRLNLIRERLASIDIANKNYYSNCFSYPPHIAENQCKITEIVDDSLDIDKVSTNKVETTEDVITIEETCEKNDVSKEASDCNHLKSNTTLNLDNVKEDELALKATPAEEASDMEIKTIFDYGHCYNAESSIELLDLNYNPPKKKYCLRETTPKMTKPEEIANWTSYQRNIQSDGGNESFNKSPDNLQTIIQPEFGECIKNEHGFDETNFEADTNESQKNSTDKDNLYVLFLDAMDQSQSGSPRSHRTVITDTTVTIESPARKPKKRRILMRSARNKVKPIDNITLWEEIRTMEAMNKRKQNSSSSKESYFQNVIIEKTEEEPHFDLGSVGSLDIPRKASFTTRFPSITKITKFCPFVSNKKSHAPVEGKPEEVKKSKEKEHIPSVANALLNMRKEQDFYFENDQVTLSSEEHSEYSDPEEDIDAYYEPYCLFCFCF